MSFKYYTGYEQPDESTEEEEEEENRDDLNESKSEQEFDDNELIDYLNKSKKKQSKKVYDSLQFEEEMSKELDKFIENQEKKYSSLLKETKKEYLVEEQSDTDSEAEMETGTRVTKKRQHLTNEELFYDPEANEQDQEWMNRQRQTSKKVLSPKQSQTINKSILKPTESESQTDKIEKYTNPKSDAILNCPGCMSLISMDCQRHERYKTQFRSMFVFNCNIKQEEQLKYPKQEKKSKKSTSSTEPSTTEFDIYKPVECKVCKTEIGVYDPKEEMYHFFNVLTSHA